ncbi:MAG: hypothetical protein ACJAUJ_001648 [Salibacteraceae bacterium]|jgi:hypothetical protein
MGAKQEEGSMTIKILNFAIDDAQKLSWTKLRIRRNNSKPL